MGDSSVRIAANMVDTAGYMAQTMVAVDTEDTAAIPTVAGRHNDAVTDVEDVVQSHNTVPSNQQVDR